MNTSNLSMISKLVDQEWFYLQFKVENNQWNLKKFIDNKEIILFIMQKEIPNGHKVVEKLHIHQIIEVIYNNYMF